VKARIMADAVLPWADDLFLHCQQLVRWVTDYVDLEESLAIGSVAQEELAHAGVLLELAGCSAEERDRLIYRREATEWRPSDLALWPADDCWPAAVARGFLLTHGSLVMVAALPQWGGDRLTAAAGVIGAEQELHARHWRRWVEILAHDPDTSDEFTALLDGAAMAAGDFFGFPAAGSAGLEPMVLHRAFLDRVGKGLVELGVDIPTLPAEPVERMAGGRNPDLLLAQLRRVRDVRDAHPDRVYSIYQ
jgi:1,2-phenylacetyl-CoA epoxidase catalytic subunit